MGLSKEQLEGKSLFDLYPKERQKITGKDDEEVMISGKPKRNIVEPYWKPKKDPGGFRPIRFLTVTHRVISYRYNRVLPPILPSAKKMEEEIRTLSLTDDLTNLYNRRGFFTLAEQQLHIARRAKRDMFLIYRRPG